MGKRLFGTDGIRGIAGEPPLDPTTVFAAGLCLGKHLRNKFSRPQVVIGEDTRESSVWIAETVAAGLKESGADILAVGVVTTPGLAYLTASGGFASGVMISASHNPYLDNGVKVFASTGYKLPDEDEKIIEEAIFGLIGNGIPRSYRLPLRRDRGSVRSYIDFLRQTSEVTMPGRKMLLDCANGSASAFAREVFSDLSMNVEILSDQPDGKNINRGCGSLFLENLQQSVIKKRADVGIAFDGDADRALFVSASGRIVDGDGVLLAASRHMRQQGTLRSDAIVGTLMTNLGLERALEREGLRLLRTPVGDKYVLEEMLRTGANLGGEQSGHIIFSDLATTGDGLLTALQVLKIMAEQGRSLDQLVRDLKVFPQVIRNVRVRERVPLEHIPAVMEAIEATRERLGGAGRVVVRYSGTELLVRVMVEAETQAQVDENASTIVQAVEQSIGKA